MVKHLCTMRETWVRSLGQEDSLEKEMATHSSILAQKIPWMEEPGTGYCPWGRKELDTTFTFTYMLNQQHTCVYLFSIYCTSVYLYMCIYFCSVAQLYPTVCDPMNCSMPGVPVLHCLPSLLKLMSVESVMPSNHLILRCPLLLLPSIFHSIRVIFKGSVSSQQEAKVSELQLQHQSFQCVFRVDVLQE